MQRYGVLTGIVWLPCSALMAAWASAWEEYFTNAQPKEKEKQGDSGENELGQIKTENKKEGVGGVKIYRWAYHMAAPLNTDRNKIQKQLVSWSFFFVFPPVWVEFLQLYSGEHSVSKVPSAEEVLRQCWSALNRPAKRAAPTPLPALGILGWHHSWDQKDVSPSETSGKQGLTWALF